MNGRVAAYRGLAETLARPLVGMNGAEQDDLVQEGLITVWLALEAGITPSADIVRKRMLTWVKWLGRQNPVPYEQMLPLEDERDAAPELLG
jgi:DNA-directed RNA polymerase specialized sigma24 family protein